jgi:AraC-like DNA-binding protein/ligand-binding sensor protein
MVHQFLEILKDNKVLTQLCEIYYQNTGMVISVHHPGAAGRVEFYPQEERSDYCRLIQSTPAGLRKCLECDREACATAQRKGGYHIYRCHAGLVDVAIPIMYLGEEIGSIYTGQIMLEKPEGKRLRLLFDTLALPDVSYERFTEAFFSVKVVERSRLLFYARLLDFMANYIIKAENEIRLQKTVVMQDRELHSREIEQIRLEKTLKDLSISVLSNGRKDRPQQGGCAAASSMNRQVIEKACTFINANFSKDITLDDVARAVFLSPNYFSSLFKKVAGRSFKSYLVRQRMEAAQRLLAETNIPIKEVVFKTGFKDYNYFNRSFRIMSGVAPASFRARYASQEQVSAL